MAITYGMSVKEFWEEDPNLFWAYRFSYIEKIKFENEDKNQTAWLQGAYIYEAVSIALANAFSKQKLSYSKLPYGVKVEEDKEKMLEVQVAGIKARIKQINKIKTALPERDNTPEEVKE
ncbi:MAG: hypothetical protein HFH08_04440 [Bacilli bacterium]|nr:hypothetical protein [Bacilli bacterium]